MHNRENLTAYEIMPEDLAIYLSHYGPHFNRKCCEFAISQMYKDDNEEFKPYEKGEVEEFLRAYGVKVKYAQLEDITYVANMCKADYLKGSVPTEQHLAMYVHETLDDPDGCEGLVFNRWIADMKWLGIAIPWSDLLGLKELLMLGIVGRL